LRRKQWREQGIVFPVAHPHPRLGKKNRKVAALPETSCRISSSDNSTEDEMREVLQMKDVE
jgi:hypothetical protein